MGISSGAQTLYHLEGLSIADVAAGIRGLYQDRKTLEELSMDMPTIDGDSNNILKVVGGGVTTTKSAAVASYFVKWKETGIIVHPMVDGKTRPVAKKASCDRRAGRHRDYIKSYTTLKEANKLKRELASGTFSAEEIVEMNADIKKLEEKSTKQLSRSQQSWPEDFAVALEEEIVNGASLRSQDKTGGYIGSVLEASYEADYAIIGRFIDKKSIAAITSDSDICVLAGDGLPCIKKFTEKGSGKGGMIMVSTCKNTLVNIKRHLPEGSKAELKNAACPIFEGVKSRKLRALMMVACGCDVFPTGIKGVGPATLKKQYLDKLKEKMPECDRTDEAKLYDALFGSVVTKSKLNANVIDTFVKALLYQPTNYKSCEGTPTNIEEGAAVPMPEPHSYMEEPPPTLPSYLFEDFAKPNFTTLDEGGPDVATCMGAEDHTHKFILQIGWKKCHGCGGIICDKCKEEVNDKPFCLSCATGELLIPSQDEGYMERIQFMRDELKHRYQWDNADDMAVDQVEPAYNAAIKPYTEHMDLIDDVKLPLYSTSELYNPTKWKTVNTIHFCNGGTFISDPSLSNHVPALLHLFASFIKYQHSQTKQQKWMADKGVYDALPAMIINFAQRSRVASGDGTGFRLLQRCVRHGHDPRMPSLFYNKAEIIELEDGTIGLVINSKVPASMRGVTYNTKTAHTATDILATECECKSGCNGKSSNASGSEQSGDEKIVCVHNSTLPYGITKLMHEGLAEHILIELTSCIVPLYNTWDAETKKSVKESIMNLMQAAGKSINELEKAVLTIEALLDRFHTGTEKVKTWGQCVSKFVTPPKPGPIRDMCFDSPTKKAKDLKDKKKTENEASSEAREEKGTFVDELNERDKDGNGEPNYLEATSLIRAAGIDLASFDPVGCRLLKLRANKTSATPDNVIDIHKRMTKGWNELQSEAAARERRVSDAQLKNVAKKRTADQSPAIDASYVTPTPNRKKMCQSNEQSKAMLELRVQPQRMTKAQPEPAKKKRGRPKIHHDGKPPPKRKKPNAKRYCAKDGCPVNDLTLPKPKFHCIPAIPPELALDAQKGKHIKRMGKLLLRMEIMDRAGFKRALNPDTSFRICEEHAFEHVTKTISFLHTGYAESELKKGDDEWVLVHECRHSYDLHVLEAEGPRSTDNLETTKVATGMATDRMKRKQLEEVKKQMQQRQECSEEQTGKSPYNDNLIADAAESRLALQLMAEINSPSRRDSSSSGKVSINQSVARAAGLQLDFDHDVSPVKTPRGEKFFYSQPVTPASSSKKGEKKNFTASHDPVVQLGMDYDQVRHRTGFPNESMLLAFVFLVCEGDIDLVKRKCTPLTWYEEWFFFAEMIYGRSFTNWWQATNAFGPQDKYMRNIFRQKLALVKRARQRWGYFVTYEEDIQLRKDKWNIKYRERDGSKTRVIMWDMTGIEAYRFGAAELQRNTYSKYYGGNYFKGGIGMQLCSWGLTWPLWGGHESDSGYHESAGYLEAQEEFQKKDLVERSATERVLEVVPFTNVLDKGYRARAQNWRRGEQLTAQPIFGKSDQQFKGAETKYSASLASDRGANERGVNVSKRSGIVKRGFKPGMDPEMFDDVWLCWGFMANFMYKQTL